MYGIDHHHPKSQSCCMSMLEDNWEKIVFAVTTVSAAILGAGFIATAGMGLVGSICLGALVTSLSGCGGFAITSVLIEVIQRTGAPQDRVIISIITLALTVIGALVGFFVYGGVVAAAVGALTLTGVATAAGFLIEKCFEAREG